MRRAALAALVGLAGCGGDDRGVAVTEAEPVVLAPAPGRAPRSAALDTTYAADTLFAALDSLAAADSLAPDTLAAAAPDAAPTLAALQASVRDGRRAALDTLAPALRGADRDLLWALLAAGPFRDGLLALAPRDLRRDGLRRTARVVVGYDAAGRVVPQDEAERDRTLAVHLGVADGAYRITGVELP